MCRRSTYFWASRSRVEYVRSIDDWGRFFKSVLFGGEVFASARFFQRIESYNFRLIMKFELPKLPYAYDVLEPFIDARTMEIHHTKHHQAYVTKLNDALAKYPSFAEVTEGKAELEALEVLLKELNSAPEDIRGAVRNHGGGHFNHSLFWKIMASPKNVGGVRPSGELAAAINGDFGSFEKFKEMFSVAAGGIFGSGWAWLAAEGVMGQESRVKSVKLQIITTPNQDSPISQGLKPILGLDVWEHAYYLKYQNRRSEYIDAWWSVVNWEEVAKRYGTAV